MLHKSYANIVRGMVAGGWGKDVLTDGKFIRKGSDEIDIADACLMSIVDRIECITNAVADQVLRDRSRERQRAYDEALRVYLEPIEAIHGPCPGDVLDYWSHGDGERVLRDFRSGKWPGMDFEFEKPVGKGPVLDSYNSWKRHRAKRAR